MNDGGPAFPVLVGVDICGEPSKVADVSGMTLRDWFAGNATEEDVRCWIDVFDENGAKVYPSRSRQAARYAFADSMIAERSE